MLRKLLFAVVASMVVAGSAEAQLPIDIGLTAGVAMSTFTGDDFDDDVERLVGPFAGVVAMYRATPIFSIESGVHYVVKGVAEEGGDGEVRATYLEIPLLARVAFDIQGTSIRPVVMAGAAVAYNISCDFEEDGVETDCDDDEEFPLKGLDFGLTGGVGVDYAISGVILTPYVRYTQGLTDIPDFEGLDLNIRNNSIQIGLTGRIPLGR